MVAVIGKHDEGRVRVLTMDRPDSLNALNSEMLFSLQHHLAEIEADDGVGCVVIRGAGDRAFCAGADLDEIRGLDYEAAHRFLSRGHGVMTAIAHARVPVVAAVDGWALGGGFELMLACHIVVASTSSRFGLPEAKIGCMPGFGGTQRLLHAVGKPVALRMMLSGEPIDAQTAWQVGLLSQPPVPPADLEPTVRALAESIASGSRTGMKRILDAAGAAARPAALDYEAALAAAAIASADGQEGITAFAERRPPIFARGSSS
ncbi:enoyl-CoA hydratase/isomerase family protein [Nocardia sp. CA-107356]|uniref:enoyl-CoA hydratase/isomerase family protein n=1 Tax=Nocardia sp. CA-107356 TaxID=3239972 RepID=UPI003D90492D